MSTKTIIQRTPCSVENSLTDILDNNANKYLLLKRFRLGEGYSREDQKYNLMLKWIFDLNNCELNEQIDNKITSINV